MRGAPLRECIWDKDYLVMWGDRNGRFVVQMGEWVPYRLCTVKHGVVDHLQLELKHTNKIAKSW